MTREEAFRKAGREDLSARDQIQLLETPEEDCPPTDKCPPSPMVQDRLVHVEHVDPKNYASFKEFWDDPCWGGPIDW